MGTLSFDLYLDDSGWRDPDHRSSPRRDGMDHFAFGGLLMKSENLHALIASYDCLVEKYEIDYPLHSTKIRGKKDRFRWLGCDEVKSKEFYDDLETFLCGIPGHAIACCIHRPGYNKKYKEKYGDNRWKLCKTSYAIVVERAAKFAMKHGRKLVVYVEQTGKREDADIRRYHEDLVLHGLRFDENASDKYKPLSQSAFASVLDRQPHFVKKENKPIQVADLLLYPVVKGGYDPTYSSYLKLRCAGKLIDCALSESERASLGIKYSCFDFAREDAVL